MIAPSVEVTVQLPLTEPVAVVSSNGSEQIDVERVQWRRTVHDTADYVVVTAFDSDHRNRSYWPPREALPDWVPAPPVGWDVSAEAFIAARTVTL